MKNKLLFISATHGDEEYSIKILDELEKKYPRSKYGFRRIIGNPVAFKRKIRYLDTNLNRSAPGSWNSKAYEKRRAFEIMNICKKYEYVIDLHGARSNCGIAIIICKPSLENFILAGMLDIKRIVVWRTIEDLKSGPLTQFCRPAGLEIECGKKTDSRLQTKLKITLGKFIENYQKISVDEIMDNLKKKEIYAVYDKLIDRDESLNDFKKVNDKNEPFFPFMSNVYPKVACYKMKKINFGELFLGQSKI